MKAKVRFFARCREIVGDKQKEVEIVDGIAHPEVILKDAIALFPPVSGG